MRDNDEVAKLTADLVLLAYKAGVLHVLLIQRRGAPFKGDWAYPGGHLNKDEKSVDAAIREGEEETGIRALNVTLVRTYNDPGRDPRGRYSTDVYVAGLSTMPTPKAGSDAKRVEWFPVASVMQGSPRLAFDHKYFLAAAMRAAGVHA